MSGRARLSRRRQLAIVFVAPSALLLALAGLVFARFRVEVPPRLDDGARAAAIAVLRAALEGGAAPPVASVLGVRALPDGGPAIVSLWLDGKVVARVEGRGADLGKAIAAAAAALTADPKVVALDPAARERARVAVDLVVGRGPVLRTPEVLGLFTLHPGLEGLGVALPDGRELLVGPDDLVRARTLFARRPVASIPDLNLGLDWPAIETRFASAAGIKPTEFRERERRYFRIRVDGFVERAPGQRAQAPAPLTRGVPPPPLATAASLTDAAIEGGRYLVRHLSPKGRYIYEVDLITGRGTNPERKSPYSLPRHAGTTYFLAELYRLTKQDFLREPIERAFGHLGELVQGGGCGGVTPAGKPYACVVDRGEKRATLGSTALTVVALVEYRRATGQPTYDDLSFRLTEWMLWLQRDDGSFAHVFDVPSKTPDPTTQMLYYTGEAALALARMYEVHEDPRYIQAAERALDHLTSWYDFFAGGFFYGEEHWTCIASAAAWPALKHRRYLDFCLGYGDFLRRQQVMEGDFPDQEDLVGTYGFSPFVVPNNTPAGSRTEAMISTYELARFHGERPEDLRKQILRSVGYALSQQVARAGDHGVAPAADGLGAVPSSPLDRKVRIDFVQHVGSAMIRAAPIAAE